MHEFCSKCKRAVLTENVHQVRNNTWFLYVCMLCFHFCTHVCFHLISNVLIVRTFENRTPFQMFEKWHNVSYCYICYIKSETSDIWRTSVWFLKTVGEMVEENHIYHLVKLNSTVKTRTLYRGCYQVFFKNGKINSKSKIWNFNINFQT